MTDLLGDILSGVRLASTVFCRAEMSLPWGFEKERLEGAPFHAIVEGEAWLKMNGEAAATRLGPGDLAIVPHGDPHRLLGSADAASVRFKNLLEEQGRTAWRPGMRIGVPERLVHGGGGTPTVFISGVFAFADRRRNPLLEALPRLVHIAATQETAPEWLSTTLRQLEAETLNPRPGAAAVVARLADILFIQAIRAHLDGGRTHTPGWLQGMSDRGVSAALAAIHDDPTASWTVASLAKRAGLSRTVFAARFARVVGRGPIAYLTEWRLHEAAGSLAGGRTAVGVVAADAGYGCELAFAKAFRRHFGVSPSAYRRSASTYQTSGSNNFALKDIDRPDEADQAHTPSAAGTSARASTSAPSSPACSSRAARQKPGDRAAEPTP